MNNSTFINRLYLERKRKRLTQDELARSAGITRVTYSNIESGKAIPTVPSLVELAVKLQCSIDYLMGLTDVRETSVARPDNIFTDLQNIIDNIERNTSYSEKAKSEALTLLKITKRIINE